MTNLRKLAKGQQCQIRIPGFCTWIDEESVLCHLNGAGLGIKENNLIGAWGCSVCHSIVDRRMYISEFSDEEIEIMFYEGIFRTQRELIAMGIIETG